MAIAALLDGILEAPVAVGAGVDTVQVRSSAANWAVPVAGRYADDDSDGRDFKCNPHSVMGQGWGRTYRTRRRRQSGRREIKCKLDSPIGRSVGRAGGALNANFTL